MAANGSFHFTTAGQSATAGGAASGAQLWTVVVGTGAASAVVTIKDGGSSGTVVATIDASAKGYYNFAGMRTTNQLYATLTGGNADVTVTFQ